MFLDWAAWFAGPGIVPVSIINAFVAMVILTSGFKNYVRLQRVMWISILVSFGTMLVVLALATVASVATSLDTFSTEIGGSSTFVADADRRDQGRRHRPEPAVQPAGHPPDRADRVDLAPVGDLLDPAERRDQGGALVPEPGVHHRRLAHRHRAAAGPPGLRARARDHAPSSCTSPAPATGRVSPRRPSTASTCGRTSSRSPWRAARSSSCSSASASS